MIFKLVIVCFYDIYGLYKADKWKEGKCAYRGKLSLCYWFIYLNNTYASGLLKSTNTFTKLDSFLHNFKYLKKGGKQIIIIILFLVSA